MRLFIILVATLAITGCASTLAQVEKGIVEPKVDALYDRVLKRWCAFPVDVQARALRRGAITFDMLLAGCPDWRAINDAARRTE